MATTTRNLIEYSGIADYIPNNVDSFKQITIEEYDCLQEEKPDIEQITAVLADVEILTKKVIKTPAAMSLEGQGLTGWKLFVDGIIKQKIEYVAADPMQSVYAANFNPYFSAFIVLPSTYARNTPTKVNAYIEDIDVEMVDERCIYKNISLLITVDLC